ncbi:MAG: EamA family transporter [Eubacteriales bacterium]|nr:EamA family transporter [Eubacteriales bacterium]
MDYLMIFGATLLLAVNFVIGKLCQKEGGASLNRSLLNTILGGAFSIVIMFFINGCTFHFNWTAALLALGVALTGMYNILGFRIMKKASLALYTFFLMTGGMIVPYVYGLIFLNEPFSVWRTIGLALIFFSLFLNGKDSFGKCGWQVLALCVGVFLLNGFVSVFSKAHQISPEAVTPAEFSMMGSAIRIVVCAAILPFTHPSSDEPKRLPFKLIPYVALSALIGGISYLLQLISASTLPATVCYPILTGGSMIFTALAGALFFREKPGKMMIVSLIIAFIGTCMFL